MKFGAEACRYSGQVAVYGIKMKIWLDFP